MSFSLHTVLNETYRHYFDLFHRYITRKKNILDRRLRDDILSDAFMKVTEKEDQIDDEQQIKSLLRMAIDETCEEYTACPQKNIEESSSDDYEEEDFMKLVWKEIDKLPVQRRRILRKLYYHELTSKQVAEEMRLSEQTVRNQKAKAFKVLRKILSENFFL